ncbi:SoxR reducing system RseC family protein [Pseudothermotoga elfii]
MARETMVVTQVKESTVILEKERTSMCGKCPANMFCTGESQKIRLEVQKAGFDLKIGDKVIVETPATGSIKTAMLVYTLPTIIFVGSLITTISLLNEIEGLLISTAAVAAYYFFLRFYDTKFRKKFRPRIIEILRV